MSTERPALDKGSDTIRQMFAEVAPRYDLLNHVLSGALDVRWRRRAAQALALGPEDEVLDLCCGTGDQMAALAPSGARLVGADFCLPMLVLARRKLARTSRDGGAGAAELASADALSLPFAGGRFSAAVVSFGLRNVADLDLALGELARVLAPGGRLAVLEFALPVRRPVRAAYLFYFRHILPRIGALLSPRASAYRYLPASVEEFPQRAAFTARMEASGLVDAGWEELSAGTVCLYSAHTPAAAEETAGRAARAAADR